MITMEGLIAVLALCATFFGLGYSIRLHSPAILIICSIVSFLISATSKESPKLFCIVTSLHILLVL